MWEGKGKERQELKLGDSVRVVGRLFGVVETNRTRGGGGAKVRRETRLERSPGLCDGPARAGSSLLLGLLWAGFVNRLELFL